MSTTSTPTTTVYVSRRMRRNSLIKNIALIIMAIIILVLAVMLAKSGKIVCGTNDAINFNDGDVNVSCNHEDYDYDSIVLLENEINALRAENVKLKNNGSCDSTDWKSKYEKILGDYNTLKNEHANCSNGVETEVIEKIVYVEGDTDHSSCEARYNEIVNMYNNLYDEHKNCGNVTTGADHGSCVSRATYNELLGKYNALDSEYASFKSAHANCGSVDHSNCGNVIVEADHSNCVSISDYNALNNELNSYKSGHTNCVSRSTYDALVNEHANCSEGGTVIVEADHSSCVSLSDYMELLAKYNEIAG